MLSLIFVGVISTVVGFVAGILVGRANSSKVNVAVATAKSVAADVKAKV